ERGPASAMANRFVHGDKVTWTARPGTRARPRSASAGRGGGGRAGQGRGQAVDAELGHVGQGVLGEGGRDAFADRGVVRGRVAAEERVRAVLVDVGARDVLDAREVVL